MKIGKNIRIIVFGHGVKKFRAALWKDDSISLLYGGKIVNVRISARADNIVIANEAGVER